MRSPLLSSIIFWFALLGSCGGGGGGGGVSVTNDPPVLVSASWSGSGAAPSAGDALTLFFSLDVTLVAGKTLDAADFALSAGSLGAVSQNPSQPNPRSVRITLGSGVSFVSGSATLSLSSANDAILGANGKLAVAGTPRPITKGDGTAPTIPRLTLNGIDALLNGTGPAGGTLQVPRSGFTIDLTHSDAGGIDLAKTVVVASVNVVVNGTGNAAGVDLAGALTKTADQISTSLYVSDAVVFPEGSCTVSVFVFDQSGLFSAPATFAFAVKALNDAARPLENGQTWFLDLSRDIETYSVNLASLSQPVAVTPGANSRPDFDDLLHIVGLFSSTPIAVGSTGQDSNQYTLGLVKSRMLIELGALYSGANVAFTFTAPGTFPAGQSSVAYGSFAFSQICIAGAEGPSGNTGVLGVALFDPNNARQDNNCLTDYQGQRLGVFVHTIVNDGMKPPSSSLFRTTFDALTPARAGTSIGNDAQDGARLLGQLSDSRATTITNAITRMARFAAVVAAHEMGHSLGLVKDGALPTGLYGGDSTNFPGSTGGHIRMPASVFPVGSTNVMSPSLSFDSALSASTAFNTLNLAYLRERVVVNP